MHLTAPSYWSRSIGTGGRDASERVVTIVGMRTFKKTDDRAALRGLLKRGQIADIFDPSVERRFGEVIGRVVFDPAKKQWW